MIRQLAILVALLAVSINQKPAAAQSLSAEYEKARSASLDNRLKAAQTYLEMQKLFARIYLPAERALAYAAAAEMKNEANRRKFEAARVDRALAKERKAFYLDENKEFAAEGAYLPVVDLSRPLQWPRGLRGDEFALLRNEIDSTLAPDKFASTRSLPDQEYVCDLAEKMRAQLQCHIRQMPTDRYVQARRFLDELVQATLKPWPGSTKLALAAVR